ncbi:MaoC/PaaZ C-terminal domain-containing protein [Shewanella sp. Isolate11]|uniref:MaoC/PaaZ C-terminal domain-containing protein n=1 Tax=Shewanella sp. Isolate11 TaxID=2908530 RepID=UPI001EFD22A9|nr:MaoC/PaaZ C-terminal domain-containing protein [Shewanella sp. Isolate11]MCG9695525.1 dehydratase [Shewanella sp. Isolate11]
MPSLLSLYRKIFFGRKPGWDQQPLPHIRVSCPNVSVSGENVQQYANVCGFDFNGKVLPITYLYVLAFRLHATIFTHQAVTFPLLGMIHLKNSISQYRQVTVNDSFNIECELTSSQTTDSGLEFELVSKAFVGDELVWESLSTYLYRIESAGRRVRPPKASTMEWNEPAIWELSEDLGRRYAKASGDYNLIHLHPVLSKRFGFDRVLAHGMWSKARSIAELMPNIGDKPCTVEVAFKLPLLMPAQVSFGIDAAQESGLAFELRDIKGRRPHLTGSVKFHD